MLPSQSNLSTVLRCVGMLNPDPISLTTCFEILLGNILSIVEKSNSKIEKIRARNLLINGKFARLTGQQGWSGSDPIGKATQTPFLSGVKLSAIPGKASANVSTVPSFSGVNQYFTILKRPMSETKIKSSFGDNTTPFANHNLSIKTVSFLLDRE